MKCLWLPLAMLAVIALTGCPESPKGGTTGGTKAETFSLDKVLTTTNLKQGGANEVTIKLNRDQGFKQNVKLSAENVPDKVKVEFNPATIGPSAEPRSVMKVTADKDTNLGDHTIVVKATPDSGSATSIDVKINVDKP